MNFGKRRLEMRKRIENDAEDGKRDERIYLVLTDAAIDRSGLKIIANFLTFRDHEGTSVT
jgi:hypothetical protein